ncbi:MAG: DUF2200 family protein [Candidatus Saccharimonadales bacterium]
MEQKPRIYRMSFADVYPAYIAKAKRKGRTKAEVDEIILWLTGYNQEQLEQQLANNITIEDFYALAPAMNPARSLYNWCGLWR